MPNPSPTSHINPTRPTNTLNLRDYSTGLPIRLFIVDSIVSRSVSLADGKMFYFYLSKLVRVSVTVNHSSCCRVSRPLP